MAIILVLSEAVTDVQALVDGLAVGMSRPAVVEYLSHIATYLLAMVQNEVKISSSERRYQATHEQQQILSHDIQPDHMVKIVAFAGTGKTSTLVRFAEERPHLRFLYVAFNKSVASEAQRCFPTNVACKTVHSMAYRDIGKSYQLHKKLGFSLKVFSIARALPAGRGGYVHGKVVTTTLSAFMASADRQISACHVPISFKNHKGITQMLDHHSKMEYVQDCEEIWRKMKDFKQKQHDGHFMTHDGYLKLWQLKEPRPCLTRQYDIIFIDEAQDCTPAIMDVLLSQRCAKVLVGDPHQQIYTFKGASFRFGPEIAYVGATLLQVCKKVQKILVGGNQKGSVYGENFDPVAQMPLATSPALGSIAILSRSNFGVFNEAGVSGIGLGKILDIWLLKQTRHRRDSAIEDAFIRSFGGYKNLQAYALQSEDRELEGKLAVVEMHGQHVPELVARLRACHEDDLHRADFVLGTVHKAKGLEFDTVMVCDDFARVPVARHHLNEMSADTTQDEWNLLYVAVTRAKSTLIMTRNIRNILTQAGEYFLKSEMTDSLLTEGQPPCCVVPQCLHHVSAHAAFTMCKRHMKF
ncbi:hypothetical protein NHX12_020680, partial [Muraenolepis orangiensis]